MGDFQNQTYNDVYKLTFGDLIWSFLNRDSVVEALVDATEQRKPALAGIDELYTVEFGKSGSDDRVKMMVGAMVRQILEGHGYKHDSHGHAVNGSTFSVSSMYSR